LIVFSICEWGGRQPWFWAAGVGGQLWRTTGDVRYSWKSLTHNLDINANLSAYAGPGRWNDPDMLIVGLRGSKGPAGDLGGTGCNDIEYQSNMSLWCMMASPLVATNDVRNMNTEANRILLNDEMIAIDQDALGKQADKKTANDSWEIFEKPLSNGDYAVAVLNRSAAAQTTNINFSELGLDGKYEIRDVWEHKIIGKGKSWKGAVQSHETKVFRLKNISKK
ncbi:MAG TPA: hypothetical protein VN726_10565, partial [Hanamia sp.]|nr:hypothetical protein [Hanamia sp.]